MADDVEWYRENRKKGRRTDGKVHVQSFFDGYKKVTRQSVDLLVTSPPYASNYHYNRNTRAPQASVYDSQRFRRR